MNEALRSPRGNHQPFLDRLFASRYHISTEDEFLREKMMIHRLHEPQSFFAYYGFAILPRFLKLRIQDHRRKNERQLNGKIPSETGVDKPY